MFNILGENVLRVVDDVLDAGYYKIKLDMSGLASGMYFYKLTALTDDGKRLHSEMKKMILMR